MKSKRIFFALLFFAAASGCGGKQNLREVQQSNEALKICCLESDQSLYVAASVLRFQQTYPEVEVEVSVIPDDNAQEESERLETELMGGNGADIYLGMENYFRDIYKIQKAGYFENLMPWFRELDSFSEENYVNGTFDLYETGDACCVMPTYISSLAWACPETVQETLDLKVASWENTEDILDAIDRFYAVWPEETPFSKGAPFYLEPCMMGFRISQENVEVFDGEGIRGMEAAYKRQVYPHGESTFHMDYERYLQEMEAAICGTRPCLGVPFGIAYLDEYIRMGGEEHADVFPALTPEGKIGTLCTFQNAIASQSPNKENAFHFLQMLLEDNWKNTAVETVRKDINRELLEGLEMQYTREQVTVDGEVYPGLTEKTFSTLKKWEEQKEIYALGVTEINEKYDNVMEAFYTDEKEYEECIEEYKDYLKIYYSE